MPEHRLVVQNTLVTVTRLNYWIQYVTWKRQVHSTAYSAFHDLSDAHILQPDAVDLANLIYWTVLVSHCALRRRCVAGGNRVRSHPLSAVCAARPDLRTVFSSSRSSIGCSGAVSSRFIQYSSSPSRDRVPG